MPLKESIESIIQNLRQGFFPNEQAISQGVVLRLLHELGWNTFDTTQTKHIPTSATPDAITHKVRTWPKTVVCFNAWFKSINELWFPEGETFCVFFIDLY
jgi:hypothetical protein